VAVNLFRSTRSVFWFSGGDFAAVEGIAAVWCVAGAGVPAGRAQVSDFASARSLSRGYLSPECRRPATGASVRGGLAVLLSHVAPALEASHSFDYRFRRWAFWPFQNLVRAVAALASDAVHLDGI
jgi:hypothetical protein